MAVIEDAPMFGWFRKYVKKIGIFGVEVEFHPPTDPTSAKSTTAPATDNDPAPDMEDASAERAAPSQGQGPELTFDEVLRAILARHPDAVLGRTAQYGGYYERARHLTKYQLYTDDPLWYGAPQANGKTMWLYLGKGGKICCGDKT